MTTRRLSGSSLPVCPPLFGTPRSLERETLGPRVGQISAALGKPFMPHQQHIVDVALELDPLSGLLVYREVVLVMMRQNGKTELLLPVITHRALTWPGQRAVYSTNTAGQARTRWEDVHKKRLEDSPFRGLFTTRLQIGQEALLFNNGSSYSPISTTAKTGGTGDTTDLGVVDEAWVHEDSRIEASLRPTMLTREQPQIWVASMIPGPTRLESIESGYLKHKIKVGRARTEAGLTRDSCIFYYGAAQGLDPADPATWWSCMPALGRTIPESAIRADFEGMQLADFTAEYLSRLPDDASSGWVHISQAVWELAADPASAPVGVLALAVDVLPDRSVSAICAAGYRGDGLLHVELTGADGTSDARPGVGWTIPRLKQIIDRMGDGRPCVTVVNDRGLAEAATEAGLSVHLPQVRDVAAWCAQFFDEVAGPYAPARRLKHRGQAQLDEAVRVAEKRSVGGAWAWANNCVLTAASLAVGALLTPRVHIVDQPFFAAWR